LGDGWEFVPALIPFNPKQDETMSRDIITLACTECKERNYTGTRNKKLETGRREVKKYCPRDKKHTLHRETK
jgi:large subunit ribosomal protein L33